MPSRPANISLIHRRCPGTSAASTHEARQQIGPAPLTHNSISDPRPALTVVRSSPRCAQRRRMEHAVRPPATATGHRTTHTRQRVTRRRWASSSGARRLACATWASAYGRWPPVQMELGRRARRPRQGERAGACALKRAAIIERLDHLVLTVADIEATTSIRGVPTPRAAPGKSAVGAAPPLSFGEPCEPRLAGRPLPVPAVAVRRAALGRSAVARARRAVRRAPVSRACRSAVGGARRCRSASARVVLGWSAVAAARRCRSARTWEPCLAGQPLPVPAVACWESAASRGRLVICGRCRALSFAELCESCQASGGDLAVDPIDARATSA
jgi:hypothetical protein